MRKVQWLVPLALFLFASSAAAQVKPKILIIFDTSGSMLQNSYNEWQWGDGSSLCSNRGQQSRIYLLKQALFEVLQGMGNDEVDFALATFPMFVDPTAEPHCAMGSGASCTSDANCPNSDERCFYSNNLARNACFGYCQQQQETCSGHYLTDSLTQSEVPSPWIRYGCKISTHNPNLASQQIATCGASNNPCAAWYDQLPIEVLKVPFVRGGLDTSAEDVMIYFDQQEDNDTFSPLINPEVRAGDGWYTPLGKSLFYAHGYFHKEVILPAQDERKPCERLVVALFTDGMEFCNTETNDAFYPTKWATALNTLGVRVHTVGIDIDTSGLSQIEDIASAGGGSFNAVASNDTTQLKQVFLDIIADSLPPAETCDGADNDCDGDIDEDFPQLGQPCENGMVGECTQLGVYVCAADGSGVTCNAPAGVPQQEICDGLDNDCDGAVDEDIPGGCIEFCQPEICNGLDDDCDGVIDNNIPSGPCGTSVGECTAGVTVCEDGDLICDGATMPTPEICDGLDNDCDGVVDGIRQDCYPEGVTGCDLETGECTPICQLGQELCTAGEWGACQGAITPDPEICDGLDNNCDGTVDENAECPGSSVCVNGVCTQPCDISEFGCPVGQLCQDGWCLPDPCDPAACEAEHPGWLCVAGECVDLCVNVVCRGNEVCYKGRCQDDTCYSKGCPSGQRCVQGVCQADPCAGVTCKSNEYCSAGSCVRSCETIFCQEGEVCKVVQVNGKPQSQCVDEPCLGITCPQGQVCIDGTCAVDPCADVRCERGEICFRGECTSDLCEITVCPAGQRCQLGQCIPQNVESTSEMLATGGGGLACSAAEGAGKVPWVILIVFGCILIGLANRKRRN